MNTDKSSADFYKRLKTQLEEDSSWTATYLYKFIIPASEEKLKTIESIFKDTNAEISTRESSKGTYTSVSIKLMMESPDAVINKYIEVSKVEGVISL